MIDGGGGSSGFSADPGQVAAAGSSLTNEASVVAGRRRYGALAGIGDYGVVEQAAGALRGGWDPALDRWGAALTSLGSAAGSAARAIAGTDEQLGSAWQAAGGGSW